MTLSGSSSRATEPRRHSTRNRRNGVFMRSMGQYRLCDIVPFPECLWVLSPLQTRIIQDRQFTIGRADHGVLAVEAGERMAGVAGDLHAATDGQHDRVRLRAVDRL